MTPTHHAHESIPRPTIFQSSNLSNEEVRRSAEAIRRLQEEVRALRDTAASSEAITRRERADYTTAVEEATLHERAAIAALELERAKAGRLKVYDALPFNFLSFDLPFFTHLHLRRLSSRLCAVYRLSHKVSLPRLCLGVTVGRQPRMPTRHPSIMRQRLLGLSLRLPRPAMCWL